MNRLKVTFKWLCVFSILLVCLSRQAFSDVPVVVVPFSVSSATNGAAIAYISGQSTCGIQFLTVGSAATITVKGAIDRVPTFSQNVAGFGTSGVITNPASSSGYVASVASQALTAIELNFSGVTGTFTGSLSCSPSVIPGSSGGGGGGGGTVQISPLPLPVSIGSPLVFASLPPLATNPEQSSAGYVPGLFTDNPQNAACNNSVGGSSCYQGLTGATPVTAITGVSGQSVYITGMEVTNDSTSNTLFYLKAGTGTNCGTNTVTIYGPIDVFAGSGYVLSFNPNAIAIAPQGDSVCPQSGTAITTLNVNLQGTIH